MSLPEPLDPQPDPSASQPLPDHGRADWLCGPEEGLAAEMARRSRESGELKAPQLTRPVAPPPSEPASPTPLSAAPSGPEAPKRFGAVTPDAASDFHAGSGMTWEPAANSVPAVRRPAQRPAPAREPQRDFPMDDAEERTRVSAAAFAAATQDAEFAARPHEVIAPEAFNVTTVAMPWWLQAPHVLRTDRRLQALVGAVLVVLLAIAFWPRGERPESLGNLSRHAERFDGRAVKTGGRVGEIFQVGGGYAFYLHQGRDTLVVFTRSRVPHRGEKLTLVGDMSTGFLDGQAHAALFETPQP